MKKLLLYSLFAFTLLAVPSCGDDDDDEPISVPKTGGMRTGSQSGTRSGSNTAATFTVKFDADGGSAVSSQTVVSGETATKPQDPTKRNYKFQGWYLNNRLFDFSITITSDIILKARWEVDSKFAEKPFSVSATKKVYFSPGNLQYHCKTMQCRFAPNQYDRIDDDNENISLGYDGYIDLFGWGTGNNPVLAVDNIDCYGVFNDWGANINDGKAWRTLTKDEWTYLITKRGNASEKYGAAEVAGVQGLILLPDSWSDPKPGNKRFKSGMADKNGVVFYRTKNSYTADEWQKMEKAGAVFLPAAGYRFDTGFSGVGYRGIYWSSSISGTTSADCLSFNSTHVGMDVDYRGYGFSVRLVRQ